MNAEKLLEVQQLGDLGLACLTCLIAEQHCLVLCPDEHLDNAGSTIQDVCQDSFGLSCVVLDCNEGTTLDDFREAVLVDPQHDDDNPQFRSSLPSGMFRSIRETSNRPRLPSLDERQVANVVVVKNLDLAFHLVQIQALELIRTGRLFSHTAMHSVPRTFLFVAINSRDSEAKLNSHLNDLLAICHFHRLNQDEDTDDSQSVGRQPSFSDTASLSSISRSISSYRGSRGLSSPVITQADLDDLRRLHSEVKMTAEILTYMHDVVVTLRLSRYVAGGVTAKGSRCLKGTVKAIAVLHGLSFVTPSLVDLAIRKTYPHRIELATPETERSLRWGSDPAAIRQNMKGVTAKSAIEAVLASVDTPL